MQLGSRPVMATVEATDGVNDVLKRPDTRRNKFFGTLQQVHSLFAPSLTATTRSTPSAKGSTLDKHPPEQHLLRSASGLEKGAHDGKASINPAILAASPHNSRRADEVADDDDQGEEFYVTYPLEPQKHDEETLCKHLQSYQWDRYAAEILENVIDSPARMLQHPLISQRISPIENRGHLGQCQVYDVGVDGAPCLIDNTRIEQDAGTAQAIRSAIRELNQPPKKRHAMGRITVARELNPILFGAVHHTLCKGLDVDELFRRLVEAGAPSAHFHRASDDDARKQRSFIFNFEYFTVGLHSGRRHIRPHH